jgi:hypothetical protein
MTMISEELLPCPFCGWRPDSLRGDVEVSIYCPNEGCGLAHVTRTNYPDPIDDCWEQAVSAWNLRTSPPPSGEAGEVTEQPEWELVEQIAQRSMERIARATAVAGYSPDWLDGYWAACNLFAGNRPEHDRLRDAYLESRK